MSTTPTAPQVCDLSGASLGEAASFLAAAAQRLGALVEQGEHHALDGASQLGLVGELSHAAGLAEAAQAVIASTSHFTGDLRRAGFFSVRGLFADGIGVSAAQGSRISRLGTGMDRYPLIRAGVLAGRICPDSARAACEGLNSATADLRGAARDEARAAGERMILPVCETGTTADVEKVAASLIFHLDPESAARRALEALEKREVKVGVIGQTAVVRMVLDSWTAAQLVEVLEARIDHWFRTGSLPEHLQPTDDPDDDARRRAAERPRLLAEAFAELLDEMLEQAGTRHGSPVNVTFLGSGDVHAGGGPAEVGVPGRDGVPVPAETFERALCDAEVTDIHLHGTVADRSSLGQIARSDRRTRQAAAWVHPMDLADHDHDHGGDGDGDGIDEHDHVHDPAHDLGRRCAHVHCVAPAPPPATSAPCSQPATGTAGSPAAASTPPAAAPTTSGTGPQAARPA
ncbi:MAG: hypothetical protein AB7O74_03155 [Candidatus Nanopelagicales bacterium]